MRAGSTALRAGRHALQATIEALLIIAIIVSLAFAAALVTGGASPGSADNVLAARGGSGSGGKGSITVPDGVFGGTTTATVNPGGAGAMARARCYQGGTLVYAQYVSVDENNQATFQLGPTPHWTGGDASCTAEEGYLGKSGRWRTIATTTFNVAG